MRIKISAVSYLNTRPFIYGIERSGLMNEIELSLDIPPLCAEKLLSGKVDVGLIPVAVIPLMKEHHIVSDFCIGADGDVASVKLFSRVPLAEIKTILLDNQSKTSVGLAKVLATKWWNIRPDYMEGKEKFEKLVNGTTAAVVIGDRALAIQGQYQYEYDLAGEWKKFTGMPFVFACWVSNKKLPEDFIKRFSSALKKGIGEIPALIGEMRGENQNGINIEDYLTNKISYLLDDRKRKAMNLFLNYMKNEK